MNSYASVMSWMKQKNWVYDLFRVCGATVLIALSGWIAIPLPFTPIPIALQLNVCLFVGALLGRRLGVIAIALFLLEGALGLPVFSNGACGLSTLLGPRGGYLIGYLMGSWLTGYLIEEREFSTARLKTIAMGMGNLVVYMCGIAQLGLFVGYDKVIALGIIPFLAGDFCKLLLAYRLMKGVGSLSARE